MYHEITNKTQADLIIVKVVANSLSIVGTSFVILMYSMVKELRSFSFFLALNLAISDFLESVSNLILIDTVNVQSSSFKCQFQAFSIQVFTVSSIMWTSIIAYSLYMTTTQKKNDTIQYLQSIKKKFIFIAYCIPITLSLIMLASSQYGVSDFYQCWIKIDKEQKNKGTIQGLLIFYLPLWIAFGYNCFCFYHVINRLNILSRNKTSASNIQDNNRTFVKRLTFYPVILVFFWLFGSIYRISIFFGTKNDSLLVIHVFMASIQGFFNSLVYGFQQPVINSIKNNFIRCLHSKTSNSQYIRNDVKSHDELKSNIELKSNDVLEIQGQQQNELDPNSIEVSQK